MQVSPGIVCEWFCTAGFLHEALRQIDKGGSQVIAVVEDKTGTVKNGFVVYYKNPPEPRQEKEAGSLHACEELGNACPGYSPAPEKPEKAQPRCCTCCCCCPKCCENP